MKITVVCKGTEWQIERLKEEARDLSVEIEVIDIKTPEAIPETLGEVVIWRSSSLGGGENRRRAMNTIQEKSILINRCLARFPQATSKEFQQTYLKEQEPTIHCIPTFRFQSKEGVSEALRENVLRTPFIIKPNKGSKGEGVALIQNIDEIDLSEKPITDLVFQNFINNSGDYRVFILGGRVLGIIKRTAKNGGFLNNISQGGSAEVIVDPKIQSALRHIGTTVASVFELTLCGVDVIYDEVEQKYFFLEVNTVPQWKGFQAATGINVAREIILYCKRLASREKIPIEKLITDEYVSQLHFLNGKKFHFLSRLFLWTGGRYYERQLLELQKEYIGTTEAEYQASLQRISLTQPTSGSRALSKHDRLRFFQKYPRLEMLLSLLFKVLFVEKIYGINIRPHIRKIATDEELLQLKHSLENDIDALRTLSTHAINYLYLLEYSLGTEESMTDPKRYQEIGNTYPENMLHLQIYFFTHCIIGASKFYSEKIPHEDLVIYAEMLDTVATLIESHYQEVSLDNKFEFLVCARICGITPSLEARIVAEASASLSPDGNFLIDKLNTHAMKRKNNFVTAEHRNVLFIMSRTPWRRSDSH